MADWATKIEALISKAQSTEYPEEAEALMVKAHALQRQHSITDAMLAAAGGDADRIVDESFVLQGPYLKAKGILLGNVASNNDCRVLLWSKRDGKQTVQVIGFEGDVKKTFTLYSALAMHVTNDMLNHEVPYGENTKSFRNSFILGFAYRIGSRLAEASKSAVDEHEDSTGVALVLADKTEQVSVEVNIRYPSIGRASSTRATSSAGLSAGRESAGRANVNPGIGAGHKKALKA